MSELYIAMRLLKFKKKKRIHASIGVLQKGARWGVGQLIKEESSFFFKKALFYIRVSANKLKGQSLENQHFAITSVINSSSKKHSQMLELLGERLLGSRIIMLAL